MYSTLIPLFISNEYIHINCKVYYPNYWLLFNYDQGFYIKDQKNCWQMPFHDQYFFSNGTEYKNQKVWLNCTDIQNLCLSIHRHNSK